MLTPTYALVYGRSCKTIIKGKPTKLFLRDFKFVSMKAKTIRLLFFYVYSLIITCKVGKFVL